MGATISYGPSLVPAASVTASLVPAAQLLPPVEHDVELTSAEVRAAPDEDESLPVLRDVVVAQRRRAQLELALEERLRLSCSEDGLCLDLHRADLRGSVNEEDLASSPGGHGPAVRRQLELGARGVGRLNEDLGHGAGDSGRVG